MKVHVIIFCECDAYDAIDTSVVEVHTDIDTANRRVKELDKNRDKDHRGNPIGYYDIADPVDFVQS